MSLNYFTCSNPNTVLVTDNPKSLIKRAKRLKKSSYYLLRPQKIHRARNRDSRRMDPNFRKDKRRKWQQLQRGLRDSKERSWDRSERAQVMKYRTWKFLNRKEVHEMIAEGNTATNIYLGASILYEIAERQKRKEFKIGIVFWKRE